MNKGMKRDLMMLFFGMMSCIALEAIYTTYPYWAYLLIGFIFLSWILLSLRRYWKINEEATK